MAASGISSAGFHAASQPATQSLTANKHGRQSHSLADIDVQGSSLSSAPTSTGKIGSKVNITA